MSRSAVSGEHFAIDAHLLLVPATRPISVAPLAQSLLNPLHPKKLLLTKWSAVQPVARQKHYAVTRGIEREVP